MQDIDLRSVSSEEDGDERLREWRIVQLGEVFKFTKKPKDLQYSKYGQIPFVPMEFVPIGHMFFEQYIFKDRDDISSGTYFESGDILLAKITPSFENGKQGIIEHMPTPFGIATTEVIPIREIEGVTDRYFLFYYLLKGDIRAILASKMEGSTGRQRLSVSTLANLEMNLPPLSEQRAIARVLRIVQDAIQSRRKEIELERERKAALMHHLFTYGTGNEPTKQSEIGEIPEGWKVVQLSAISKIRYGLGQPPEKDDEGIPMIRATDIKSGRIIKNSIIKVKREAIPESRAQFLKQGDIIVVRSGAYTGDVAMYDGEWETAIAGYDLVVSPIDEGVNPSFIAHYLLSDANQSYFRSQSDRSAQSHINAEQLGNAVIPLPSLSEQNTISEALQTADSKITALEKEVSLHEELFRALLEELMTGRLSALPLVEE